VSHKQLTCQQDAFANHDVRHTHQASTHSQQSCPWKLRHTIMSPAGLARVNWSAGRRNATKPSQHAITAADRR
jgi:hypothetical protein